MMDTTVAKIIREQLIGEYNGDMASKPFNPALHSIFMMLINQGPFDQTIDQRLAKILHDMADALAKGE